MTLKRRRARESRIFSFLDLKNEPITKKKNKEIVLGKVEP